MNEEKTNAKNISAAVSKDSPPNNLDSDGAAPPHSEATPSADSINEVFEKSDAEKKKDAKRERLLNNLKKGRETALANRKKKALYKKLKKQEQDEVVDNEIRDKLDKKASLENENKQLKERLLAMEMKSIAKPPKKQPESELKPAPKPEPEPNHLERIPAAKAAVAQPPGKHIVNAFKVAPW